MNVTRYETAIGLIGEGGRLHVMYGHATAYGMSWCPICRIDSDDGTSSHPLYDGLVTDKVTCKRCRAALVKIARERPSMGYKLTAGGS